MRALRPLAMRLLETGSSEEAVAREMVERRNALKAAFRTLDDAALVAQLERRNIARYGHPLGATPDWYFERYGSWRGVIDAACRPRELLDPA